MKNITLSADEKLLRAAREIAHRNRTTLNAEFRAWLLRYTRSDADASGRVNEYRRLMAALSDVSPGREPFTREELNER